MTTIQHRIQDILEKLKQDTEYNPIIIGSLCEKLFMITSVVAEYVSKLKLGIISRMASSSH